MVYGIVKNHHGHITCVSNPGEGARFEIYLPAIGQPEETPDLVTLAMDQRVGNETILLVDDDDAVRDLGEEILKVFGYTVISAGDGESALQVYREGRDKIQLVVLDLIMPGIGGTQCLKKLLEMNPQAKVVIASGYSVAGQLERVSEIGAKAFIHKPYDVQEIIMTVRRVLDQDQ
jgi:two-component system, cell cycle sensor histidine kinase and response regulator CckA